MADQITDFEKADETEKGVNIVSGFCALILAGTPAAPLTDLLF